MKTVAAILVENFKRWGSSDIFGIPGRPVVPLTLEIEEQGLRFILTRHENGAGYAAGGYALITKGLGIAISTSGPGATNMLTSARQAMAYNAPVLFITSHASATNTGKAFGQDSSIFATDLEKMFEPVTLFSARVNRKEMLPLFLKHALEKAFTGVKGPVHLCIPGDVLLEKMEPFYIDLTINTPTVISTAIEEIPPVLQKAKRPVLFVGKGALSSSCVEEVMELAETYRLPIITTGGGKGAVVSNHPLCLGVYGLGGTEEAENYLKSGVDVMIVIGSSLSDMSIAGFTEDMFPKQVIQFDYDSTYIGKSITRPTIFIQGDAKENLRRTLDLLKRVAPSMPEVAAASFPNVEEFSNEVIAAITTQEPLNDWKMLDPAIQHDKAVKTERTTQEEQSGRISHVEAIHTIRKALPKETLMFSDAGSHGFYANKHYDVLKPGTYFFDGFYAAMGNAIGYALGAKFALKDQPTPVACITGDGCFLMQGTEISTAVAEQIPVIFFVLNNDGLDMVDKGMKHWLSKSVGTSYKSSVNLAAMAQALGANGYVCTNKAEIMEAVAQALEHKGPTLIDIYTYTNELPPTMKRDE